MLSCDAPEGLIISSIRYFRISFCKGNALKLNMQMAYSISRYNCNLDKLFLLVPRIRAEVNHQLGDFVLIQTRRIEHL